VDAAAEAVLGFEAAGEELATAIAWAVGRRGCKTIKRRPAGTAASA
jgi:hypothetical protein